MGALEEWVRVLQRSPEQLDRRNKTGVLRDRDAARRNCSGAAPKSYGSVQGLRNAKRFLVALQWVSRSDRLRVDLGRAPSTW